MTKDVIVAILERRSIRKFKPDPVPQATIGRLMDVAQWAPSAGNLEPWEFYVVLNQAKKKDLYVAANNQNFLYEAPVIIVVCAVPERSAARYGERGRDLYCIQDTATAAQNIMLAATGYGLGTCWVGSFNEEQVAKVLDLPAGHRPMVIIPVGYPDGDPVKPAKRPTQEIVHVID